MKKYYWIILNNKSIKIADIIKNNFFKTSTVLISQNANHWENKAVKTTYLHYNNNGQID